jgi:hypothetical protein
MRSTGNPNRMAAAAVLGYKRAAMRTTTLFSAPILLLLAACGEVSTPNGQLCFTGGQESSALAGISHFTVDRIDTKGKIKSIYDGTTLPETLDMGSTGTYRFRATGLDASGNAVARGETFQQDVALLGGVQAPIFLARTDRTSLADEQFSIAPGENPKVGIIAAQALWLWANPSSDHITTDAYNFAYWQQVSPKSSSVDFTSIACPVAPCDWQTLVVVGGYFAIAIGKEWALLADEYNGYAVDYPLPSNLGSFADIAGGRVLAGADFSAVIVGGARADTPTANVVGFDKQANASVMMLSAARAGAATLFEPEVGLLVVGGSSDGAGVERVEPGGDAFVALDYPPDPVTGAALVVDDATHVLRVGGNNLDGSPADSVRIDVTCSAGPCETELLTDQAIPISAAQSFYDPESRDSLIVGQDARGQALIYRYSATAKSFVSVEVPDNQQRIRATAIELSTRYVALVGGTMAGNLTSSRSTISVVSF